MVVNYSEIINQNMGKEDIKIILSNNPLDDYQRTIFSKKNDRANPITGPWPSRLSKTKYNTQLVQKINDIPILGNMAHYQSNINLDVKMTRIYPDDTDLHCIEYELPNIEITSKHKEVNGKDVENMVSKVEYPSTISKDSEDESKCHPQIAHLNNIKQNSPNILEGIVLCNEYYKDDSHEEGKPKEKSEDKIQNSIEVVNNKNEKNQSLGANQSNTLLTSGSAVIWSEDMGFVYMTGIWRLYENVMEGLVSMDRKNTTRNNELKSFCLEEWNKAVTNIFGKRSILDKKENSKYSPNEKIKKLLKKDSGEIVADKYSIKYFDFKWEMINHNIREHLLEYFKKYLIEDRNIDPDSLLYINMFPLAQKVRGGLTRIQGTWLPIQLARRLCIMFAYPIRYFLMPLFGSTFPKECEPWYHYYEKHAKQLVAYITPFDNSFVAKPNQSSKHHSSKDNSVHNSLAGGATPGLVGSFQKFGGGRVQYTQIYHPGGANMVEYPVGQLQDGMVSNTQWQVPFNLPLRGNNNFRLEKNSSKIEKPYHQNNKPQEKLPSINSVLTPELKLQSSVFNDENNKNQSVYLNQTNFSPNVSQNDQQTVFFVQPSDSQESPTNEGNGISGSIPYFNSRPDGENGSLLLSEKQPVQYERNSQQHASYDTSFLVVDGGQRNDLSHQNMTALLPNHSSHHGSTNNNVIIMAPQYMVHNNGWIQSDRQPIQVISEHNTPVQFIYGYNTPTQYSGTSFSPIVQHGILVNNQIQPNQTNIQIQSNIATPNSSQTPLYPTHISGNGTYSRNSATISPNTDAKKNPNGYKHHEYDENSHQ